MASTNTLTILLGAIAAVKLPAGRIGIMNILLASVTECIREIGMRLAIGEPMCDVLMQLLVESVAWSALGGIIGLFLGVMGTCLVTPRMNTTFLLSSTAMLMGFFFAFAIRVIFGYSSARKGARLNPIDLLRHD